MISFPELPDTKLLEPVTTFRFAPPRAVPYKPNIFDLREQHTLERIKRRSAPFGAGMDIVNTTFINSTKGYSRFNDDKNGAWYCALDHDTAVREAAYHQKRRQSAMNEYGSPVILQEIFADFTGTFRCAKELPRGEGILGADPKTYKDTQKFANKLRDEGARGIIYPSVRNPNGFCFAVFSREAVQNVRYGDCWKMSWSEEGEPIMDKIKEDLPPPFQRI